jgi:hypothetical protein
MAVLTFMCCRHTECNYEKEEEEEESSVATEHKKICGPHICPLVVPVFLGNIVAFQFGLRFIFAGNLVD